MTKKVNLLVNYRSLWWLVRPLW